MGEVVKVGPKGRHAEVPEGWHRVKSGKCLEGDKYAYTATGCFCLVEKEDVGMEWDTFDCLIRKDVCWKGNGA